MKKSKSNEFYDTYCGIMLRIINIFMNNKYKYYTINYGFFDLLQPTCISLPKYLYSFNCFEYDFDKGQ